MGPFKFEFTIPFIAGKVVEVEKTVQADGVPITLERVVVTPFGTRATLHLEPSETDRRWLPIAALTLPDGISKTGGFGQGLSDGRSAHYFTGDFTEQRGQWTLTVTEIVGVGSGQGEQKRLTGPWVFEFNVP
ncbi:MAG: hypothetical protein HYX89_08225 [Chloroflexi bacterium]|nr:hypothetical protein [Chloroflexota bacterium]